MNFVMAVKMALQNVKANKMRSFLTMLGIIIGVSAVICMVSLVNGATKSVTDSISSMGSNLLTVNIMSDDNSLTYDKAKAMADLKGIAVSSPAVSGSITAKYGTTEYDTTLMGVDSSYLSLKGYTLSDGRFIVPLDYANRNKVAVLGTDVIEELFGTTDSAIVNPINQKIEISGVTYTVVGTLESKGSSGNQSNDDMILIPLSTAQRLLQSTSISTVYLQAESTESVDMAEYQAKQYLNKLFPDGIDTSDNSNDYYRIFNQTSLLETISEVTGTMSLMLGGIAGISLIVGGIGIMNIMLVSVTERTREIGIRKAIGAKRSAILMQFLIESSVVSSLGGIIGVIAGIIFALVLGQVLSMETSTPLYIVAVSFGFSVGIGIFFGAYPANKAAKLKPVDALRAD